MKRKLLFLALIGAVLAAKDSKAHNQEEDNQQNAFVQSQKLVKTAIVVFIVLVVIVVIAVLIGSFIYKWKTSRRLKIPIKDVEEEIELQASPVANQADESQLKNDQFLLQRPSSKIGVVQEVPEEDSSEEEDEEDEEQSPDHESSHEQLHEDTKDRKGLQTIIMESPYVSIEISQRKEEFDIHKENPRSSTLMGETSLEHLRPLTPPKMMFYDSTYNVESDPEFKKKMTKRHLKSIEMMVSREKSIASSEDDRAREVHSRLSEIDNTDHDRWKRKDLTLSKKIPVYYDSAGSTQYASGFEKTMPQRQQTQRGYGTAS